MTTAVVLSGGASLGAVQVGMLLALTERGIVPDLLVGTSVGAVNAAYLAADPTLARTHALAQLWSRARRATMFPPTLATIAALGGHGDHLVDPRPLRQLIAAQLPYQRLEQAGCPITVVATDVLTGEEVPISRGPAVDAVMASAALPGILPPVRIDERTLMDGGVVDNSPISVALSLGADRVIVLPTGYACALTAPPRSALGMALHAVSLAVQRQLIADVTALQHTANLLVVPPLCPVTVSPLDFSHGRQLIDRAYAATGQWLDGPTHADQTTDLRLHRHTTAAHHLRPVADGSDTTIQPAGPVLGATR